MEESWWFAKIVRSQNLGWLAELIIVAKTTLPILWHFDFRGIQKQMFLWAFNVVSQLKFHLFTCIFSTSTLNWFTMSYLYLTQRFIFIPHFPYLSSVNLLVPLGAFWVHMWWCNSLLLVLYGMFNELLHKLANSLLITSLLHPYLDPFIQSCSSSITPAIPFIHFHALPLFFV